MFWTIQFRSLVIAVDLGGRGWLGVTDLAWDGVGSFGFDNDVAASVSLSITLILIAAVAYVLTDERGW